MVIFFYKLESDSITKLKHKGKFAIQYSIGVKTKKTGWIWEKLKQVHPVH